MAPRDLYDILGVAHRATAEEIKKAFRRLARAHHPDLNPGNPQAEVRFKELQNAYDILSDPHKRSAYDRYGHAAFVRGSGGMSPNVSRSTGDIIEEILKPFWPPPAHTVRAGADLRYHLTISLMEVLKGGVQSVEVKRELDCTPCRATGTPYADGKKRCTRCQGLGEDRLVLGPMDVARPCPDCRGTGYRIVRPCGDCGGKGRQKGTEEIKVRIPAGVATGQRLKVRGRGNGGYHGGAEGDLYVVIHTKRHPHLKREGQALIADLLISESQAEAGDVVEVPTLEGPASITLPPGIENGQTFRLKGLGLPSVKSAHRGDIHLRVRIKGQEGPLSGAFGALGRAARAGAQSIKDRIQGAG